MIMQSFPVVVADQYWPEEYCKSNEGRSPGKSCEMKKRYAMNRFDHRTNASQSRDDCRSVDGLGRNGRGQFLTGMAQRRPGHHCQCHDTCGSHHPGVDSGTRRDQAESGRRVYQKSNRNEGVADVQNEHQTLPPGAIASPTA